MRTLEQVLDAHPLPIFNLDGSVAQLEQMQKQDIVKAAGWGRCLLDLPVGYGKTVIATCISLMRGPDTTIVLVPPILIVQWVKWINSIPGAGRALAYEGSPKHRLELRVKGTRWLIMSYQIFNNDIDRLRKELAGCDVLTVVDEAQALKGRGVLFKNVRQFSAGRSLITMSGTIASKVGDYYAYIALNTPETYRSYTQFENIHVLERDFFKQPTEWRNLDLLQVNLNARRVYRTKEEVHKALPKANFIPIYYDLEKGHMKLYHRLMEEQLLALDDGSKIDATTATRLYHAAQQIIVDYAYFSGEEDKKSVVFDQVNLGDPGASKLLLWTIYKRSSRLMLEHTSQQLANRGDGSYSMAAYSEADSKKSVKHFLEDPKMVSLVAQPGSAGAGLNPQHICWECAFIEIPTTTIPFTQAYGRIDRKGQRYRPNIRIFIARGTIQEKLFKNLMANDDLVNKASGSKSGIRNLIFP